MTNTGRRLLRWASGIMVVLGVGHLSLLAVFSRADIAGWADRGVWAAVPLGLTGDGTNAAALLNSLAFWAGPGSFSVPLFLLGCLTWHLAGRGVPVPAWLGWGLAAWCLVGGVLLVPSPYFAGVVAGALIVLAQRSNDRARAATVPAAFDR